MKSVTITGGALSRTFTEALVSGFLLENATGILETKGDVIRTENAMGDGSVWNATRMNERNIVLTLRDEPTADHRRNRIRLYRVFPPKTPLTLTYTDGAVTRAITVYTESVTVDLKSRSHAYTVSLIAPYPFFTDSAPTDVNVAAWEDEWEWPATAADPDAGLFEFDASTIDTDVLEYGTRTENMIVTCENAGDVPCGIIVTFAASATVDSPGLLNVDTGEYLSVNVTMTAGDTLTVDTRFGHRTAVLVSGGVTTNVFRYIDAGSTFLQLAQGENNFTALLEGAQTTSAELDISVQFENNYVGA